MKTNWAKACTGAIHRVNASHRWRTGHDPCADQDASRGARHCVNDQLVSAARCEVQAQAQSLAFAAQGPTEPQAPLAMAFVAQELNEPQTLLALAVLAELKGRVPHVAKLSDDHSLRQPNACSNPNYPATADFLPGDHHDHFALRDHPTHHDPPAQSYDCQEAAAHYVSRKASPMASRKASRKASPDAHS